LEAQQKAEQLQKLMDLHEWHDNAVADLQLGVQVCAANCAHAAGLDQEALDMYRQLVGNSDFQVPSRMRVNIGNLYAARGQWLDAIKQYRMALDQIPTDRQASAYDHECHAADRKACLLHLAPDTPKQHVKSACVSATFQVHMHASKRACLVVP
jgi:tetratricopeptide (TPR) repeat protein